jgi:hypothetical protein
LNRIQQPLCRKNYANGKDFAVIGRKSWVKDEKGMLLQGVTADQKYPPKDVIVVNSLPGHIVSLQITKISDKYSRIR